MKRVENDISATTSFILRPVGYALSLCFGCLFALQFFGAGMTGGPHGYLVDWLELSLVVGFIAFLLVRIFHTVDWRVSAALLCSPTLLLFLMIPRALLVISPLLAFTVFGGASIGRRTYRRKLERSANEQTAAGAK